MKSIKQILVFSVILLGCISCKNKAGETVTEDEPGINIISTAKKIH